jgi:hypothetical protein
VSQVMGNRGSLGREFDGDITEELIVDLETEPVATTVSRLQNAADALANQLCAEKPIQWASVGLATVERVMYVSYGVLAEYSEDHAKHFGSSAVEKLHGQGLFPDVRVASMSVRERKPPAEERYFDDEPQAELVGTLIQPQGQAQPRAERIQLAQLEREARELVKTLRSVGERTDAESIARCLAGGDMSLQRLRALRQELVLLRSSWTPIVIGGEGRINHLIRETNLAVSRFAGTGKDLLGGPEFRRRLPKRPRR